MTEAQLLAAARQYFSTNRDVVEVQYRNGKLYVYTACMSKALPMELFGVPVEMVNSDG